MSTVGITDGDGDGAVPIDTAAVNGYYGQESYYERSDEGCTAKLYIGSERFPIINDGLKIWLRKDGPLDINRLTEAYFPSEWEDNNGDLHNFEGDVSAFDPSNEGVYDTARVELRDERTDEFRTVHAGFVESVGSGSKGTIERRVRIADYSKFLNAIPFSETYDEADALTILKDVRDAYVDHHPFFDDLPLKASNIDGEEVVSDNRIDEFTDTLFGVIGLNSSKAFTANRHTLADAIKWVEGKTDVRIYFDYISEEQTVGLVVDGDPTNTTHYANHLNQSENSIDVYKNNALYEIKPMNTLTVYGKGSTSLKKATDETTGFLDNPVSNRVWNQMGDKQFPSVTVYHETLRDLAGGNVLDVGPKEIDAETIGEAESEAKHRLKDLIDGSSGGEIITAPFHCLPYSEFRSKAACGNNITHSLPTLSYEVEEVEHEVTAKNGRQTTLNVSVYVGSNQIAVEEATMKDR